LSPHSILNSCRLDKILNIGEDRGNGQMRVRSAKA
jgi:hypothetical protein